MRYIKTVRHKGFKCLYCGYDVSTLKPHDGVEIINGYPMPCRMNGKNLVDKISSIWTESYYN